MPVFKSVDAAMAYIESAISSSLNDEVFHEVKQTMSQHAIEDVYEAYDPRVYVRRYGLVNDNIVGSVQGLSLEVENVDQPNPVGFPPPTVNKNLIQVIESGEGYDYFSPGPRPFVTNTREDLAGSGDHVKALARGLAARGIQTK